MALLLGAVAANVPECDLAILKAFSGYFGMAYQIKDDLDEFREANEHTQPADYPLLLSILAENLDESQRINLQFLYTENDRLQISSLIRDNEIDRKAEVLLQEYTDKAYGNSTKLRI